MIRDCRAQRRVRDGRLDLSTLETLLADLGVEHRLWPLVENAGGG